MRKLFLPVGIAACALLVILFAVRGCRLSDEAQAAKLKYNAYRTLVVNERLITDQRIAELEGQNRAKDAEIAVHKQAVAAKNEQIAAKNKAITALEQEFLTLTDCPAQVANLQAQVASWKEQFFTAQEVISSQEQIIGALEMKFTNQVAITNEVKAALDRSDALVKLGEQRIAVLEKDAKRFRFGSRLKTIAIAGAAGYIGYTLLCKGK